MAKPQNGPMAHFSGAQATDACPRADHAPQPLYKANARPCDGTGGGAPCAAGERGGIRPELHQLDGRAIAPLEARIAAFPEVWQELARSCYCTLLGRAGWPGNVAPTIDAALLDDLSVQAVALAMGIGADFGGSQPYIPLGMNFTVSEKYARIVRAWRAGQTWEKIAKAENITPRRVRHIVDAWQNETFAQRQGRLELA